MSEAAPASFSRRDLVHAFVAVALLSLVSVEMAFVIRSYNALRRNERQQETRHGGLPQFLDEARMKVELSDSLEDVSAGRARRIAAEYGVALRRPIVQRLGATSATLVWETGYERPTTLVVRAEGEAERRIELAEGRLVHEVRLEGLTPATRYEGTADLDQAVAFETYPAEMTDVRIGVLSDTQGGKVIERLAARLGEHDPDLVLHCGDLVNNGMRFSHWREEFFLPDVMELLSRVPLYPVLGNHEFDSPFYYAYFSLPGRERWYSFDAGPVRVFALDTNIDFSPGGAQYRWLEAELERSAGVPWRIVMFHHSPFGAVLKNDQHSDGGHRFRASLHPLLAKYEVDLALSGHEHAYIRNQPIDGVTYLVVGGGGPLGHPAVDESTAATHKHVNHFLIIEAGDSRMRVVVRDVTGEAFDEVEFSHHED